MAKECIIVYGDAPIRPDSITVKSFFCVHKSIYKVQLCLVVFHKFRHELDTKCVNSLQVQGVLQGVLLLQTLGEFHRPTG